MDYISISLIAVALAMDAFSVSITKGFTQKHLTKLQIFGMVCSLEVSKH